MDEKVNLHYGNLFENDKYVRIRYDKYIDLLKDKIQGRVKLLEIGCYTAKLAEFLPVTVDYLGVDFDEKAIEIAKSNGRNVIKMNFNESEFDFKEKFDIIIAAEVLEHLVDPEKLMLKIAKVLTNNGMVLISLPNENTIYHRMMSLLGLGIDMYPFRLYKHLHFPTIRQDIDFVSKYFKILKKEYYINPGGRGSRFAGLGTILRLIPDCIWEKLAYLFPGCFARGIIILCAKY